MTSFHVRHDFSPMLARDALVLLRMAPAVDTEDLLERARARDLEIGRRRSPEKVIASLRDLELVERPASGRRDPIRLTSVGARVADIAACDELLLAELIHLRYWSRWTPELGGEPFSWAYQAVAGALWDGAPTRIESDQLVAVVLSAADELFTVNGVSFSSSSVLGILHWLRALSPPCIVAGEFRRRPSCPPETLMLSLEHIQVVRGRPIASPIRLDAATRARACRAAMLDEAEFDEVLAQAEDSLGLVRRRSDAGDLVMMRESAFPGLVSRVMHG